MKQSKHTPRTVFQADFLKGKFSAEPKRSSERVSAQKKPKQKKPSQTIDGNSKNRSPPQNKTSNIATLKFTANNLHDLVSKLSENNRGHIFDSRHFKSNSGDHKDYLGSGNRHRNMGSPVCRNSKQSFKPANPLSSPGAERAYQKKRVLSYFDDLVKFSPQANKSKTREDKRSNSRKKDHSKKDEGCMPVTRELMDSLASLRMDATSLKAVLSNEVFRLRQSCSKESRLIENLFDGLIEGILEQKDGILQRLNKQSTSLVGEINSSMKKIDTNLRAMDKIFETMPVGKKMTRVEMDSLHDLLKKTEIDVSHTPKKLTLSEVNEHNVEDFVEDVANSLNEKLNFQVFEQDFEVIQTFNKKVARIKSEFNSMIETVDTRPRSSKLLPFEHNDIDKLKMLRPNTESLKKSEVNFGLDENKENRLDLLNLPDVNLSSNKINKIQLECNEKLQLFRDCLQRDMNRETVNLSDLECSDENLLPKLHTGLEANRDSNHWRRPSDSNILIDEDIIDTDQYESN